MIFRIINGQKKLFAEVNKLETINNEGPIQNLLDEDNNNPIINKNINLGAYNLPYETKDLTKNGVSFSIQDKIEEIEDDYVKVSSIRHSKQNYPKAGVVTELDVVTTVTSQRPDRPDDFIPVNDNEIRLDLYTSYVDKDGGDKGIDSFTIAGGTGISLDTDSSDPKKVTINADIPNGFVKETDIEPIDEVAEFGAGERRIVTAVTPGISSDSKSLTISQHSSLVGDEEVVGDDRFRNDQFDIRAGENIAFVPVPRQDEEFGSGKKANFHGGIEITAPDMFKKSELINPKNNYNGKPAVVTELDVDFTFNTGEGPGSQVKEINLELFSNHESSQTGNWESKSNTFDIIAGDNIYITAGGQKGAGKATIAVGGLKAEDIYYENGRGDTVENALDFIRDKIRLSDTEKLLSWGNRANNRELKSNLNADIVFGKLVFVKELKDDQDYDEEDYICQPVDISLGSKLEYAVVHKKEGEGRDAWEPALPFNPPSEDKPYPNGQYLVLGFKDKETGEIHYTLSDLKIELNVAGKGINIIDKEISINLSNDQVTKDTLEFGENGVLKVSKNYFRDEDELDGWLSKRADYNGNSTNNDGLSGGVFYVGGEDRGPAPDYAPGDNNNG